MTHKFCEAIQDFIDGYLSLSVKPNQVYLLSKDFPGFGIPISYCPFCGDKLIENPTYNTEQKGLAPA